MYKIQDGESEFTSGICNTCITCNSLLWRISLRMEEEFAFAISIIKDGEPIDNISRLRDKCCVIIEAIEIAYIHHINKYII